MAWITKGTQPVCKRVLTFISVLFMLVTGTVHAQMPDWVQVSTADSDQYMYGIGSGASLEQAKNMALGELAGKVNSQVQQLFQMQEQAENDTYSSQMSLDTRVAVGSTDLKYFYVNQTEQLGNVYWVELVLDKSKMAEDLKARFDVDHSSLTSQMQALLKQSMFMQYLQANAAAKTIKQLKQLILQIKFYSPAFSTVEYVAQYNSYLTQLQEATANNQVYLDDENADQGIAKHFRDWLALNGVNLAAKRTKQTDVIELVTVIDAFQDNRNAYNAQLTTTISVISEGAGQIGHATIKTRGRDYKREAQALVKASNAFKSKIARSEPAKLLNISL